MDSFIDAGRKQSQNVIAKAAGATAAHAVNEDGLCNVTVDLLRSAITAQAAANMEFGSVRLLTAGFTNIYVVFHHMESVLCK